VFWSWCADVTSLVPIRRDCHSFPDEVLIDEELLGCGVSRVLRARRLTLQCAAVFGIASAGLTISPIFALFHFRSVWRFGETAC